MNRPVINFSWNWNAKLFCKCFTTIRLHNPGKYQVGRLYDIQLHKKDMGPGTIVNISTFRLDQLNVPMAYIDMGYTLEKCKTTILNMYKNKGLNFATQLFDYIVIEQKQKILLQIPDELFGRYVDEENQDLFTNNPAA